MKDGIVETERLTIRPWRVHEAEILFAIRSDVEVAKWLDPPEPWTDLRQALDAIVGYSRRIENEPPLGDWAVVPNELGHPVGSVSLHKFPRGDLFATGWYLHPDAFGNGYAPEAAKAMIAAGFAGGLTEIWAVMFEQNEASARVAAKAGMTDLGLRDDPWYGTAEHPQSRMFCAYAEGSTGWSSPSVTS